VGGGSPIITSGELYHGLELFLGDDVYGFAGHRTYTRISKVSTLVYVLYKGKERKNLKS
jgi:hypothetical protein